jgi:aminocarboxymuconate-semialdehyde decarboxylase
VTHDPVLLRRLIEDAGPDHVLLGSDRPFDIRSDDPVGEVRALGLPAADEAAVLGGNAARLLGLPALVCRRWFAGAGLPALVCRRWFAGAVSG